MNESPHILIIDDEPDIRELVKDVLEDEGYQVSLAANAAEAKQQIKDKKIDLALLDIWMPGEDGISLLRSWAKQNPSGFPVLIMSGHGTVETAVEATKLGAKGFIEKPLNTSQILQAVSEALDNKKAKSGDLHNQHSYTLAGASPAMQALRKQLGALLDSPVKALAVSGEPGSGHASLAYYLHDGGERKKQTFKSISAAALPAPQALDQALEEAFGGTLFINDIEEGASPLYNALAEKLGRTETQIIIGMRGAFDEIELGAAGKALKRIPRAARLRIPPLHERPADVLDIIKACVDYHVRHHGLPYRQFPTAVKNRLLSHHWLDNTEALSSLIEQLLVDGKGDVGLDEVESLLDQDLVGSRSWFNRLMKKTMRAARREFEYAYLKALLQELGGNVSLLAEKTGMERTHLYRKLKSLGINLRP